MVIVMFGIIYKAENKVNGNVYIGKTTKILERRIKEHYRDSKHPTMYFTRALKKYGTENFEWSILLKCINEKELNEMEKFFIANYSATNYLYNLTKGGDGISGYRHTDRTKKIIGFYSKGNTHAAGNIPWNKGKPWNEETKRKVSDTKKKNPTRYWLGKKRDKKTCIAIGNAKRGRKASEETKKKMSLSASGIKNHFYGKKHTEETKQKIRDAKRKNI